MSSDTRSRLAKWIGEHVSRGQTVRLELRHMPVDASDKRPGAELEIIDVPAERAASWAEGTADQIVGNATNDAAALEDGIQKYAVIAFGEGRKTHSAIFRFVADAPRAIATGGSSEPATLAGALAQAMRHLEARERTMTMAMGLILNDTSKRIEALTRENDELREHRLETLETVEKLLSMQQERDLEAKKAEAKIAMLGDVAKDAKLLAPAIVNRLAGKEIIPANATGANPRDVAIQRLKESLTLEQQAKIAETLDDTQKIALMELFQSTSNTN